VRLVIRQRNFEPGIAHTTRSPQGCVRWIAPDNDKPRRGVSGRAFMKPGPSRTMGYALGRQDANIFSDIVGRGISRVSLKQNPPRPGDGQ